ncbi:uncharacterized protein LOC111906216 isoform X3 [Lactuca sativa]|uniref:uncharacterized protein LOC111906216 isoform X3 n=1 Tax=Lactuca sativa TaxID=4236 RepID=UPI000CD8618F|nr:uncharacterized protein LOC111906216 isoform X3 [Lactuca sativa]
MKMLEEGEHQTKIAQKQIKFQEVMEKVEEDAISALPDCLLQEILSRLPSTKDAIKTVKANLNRRCRNSTNVFTMPEAAEQEMFKEFILNLGHVKELEIGFDCSKVISCLQAKGFVVPSNVKLTRIE